MGYQEAYLTSTDESEFQELLDYARENRNKYLVTPVEIVTIKFDIKKVDHYGLTRYREGNYGFDCSKLVAYDISHLPTEYKSGSKFIYFIGERGGYSDLLLDLCDTFKCLDLIYTEDFPSYKIFENNKNKRRRFDKTRGKHIIEGDYAVHEEL